MSRRIAETIEWARENPDKWAEKTFGVNLWDMQREIMLSVWNNRYTVCKSCFASGKSFLGGVLAQTFLHLHKDSIVLTTAPTLRQVRLNVWQNIHWLGSQARAPLGSRLLSLRMECGPNWYAEGFSTDEAERIQGFHAQSGNILIIVDESAAVSPAIHERIKALMTSEKARRLDIGNPLDPSGPFFDFFANPDYKKFTISAFDTPNVREGKEIFPGLVTKTWVDERRREWGEDSPMWKSQVLGQFPDSSENSLIPMSWIRMAQERWHEESAPDGIDPIHGVDISRGGMSETVYCTRIGMYVPNLRVRTGITTMEAVGEMHHLPQGLATIIYVDDIGVGGGPVDRAREIGLPVIGINVQTRPEDDPLEKESGKDGNRIFLNKRAELYWEVRKALDPEQPGPRLCLPPDDLLASQLASIKVEYDSKGRIKIQSKEDMRKNGRPSPDRADALMLTFAHEVMFGPQAQSLAIPIGVGPSQWLNNDFGYSLGSWSEAAYL